MKKKRIWKEMASAVLAASMIVTMFPNIPVSARDSAEPQNVKSPWESDWQENDPASITDKYQIYPVPQKITYPQGDTFTIADTVNVVAGEGVDAASKDYLAEVLNEYGREETYSDVTGEGNDIILGIRGSQDEADQWFENQDLDGSLFENNDAYALYAKDGDIVILGADTDGVFYGVATLKMMFSSFAGEKFLPVEIQDYSSIDARGFIEGFYGGWNHEQRKSLMKFTKDVKMNLYVYASKTDPYHTGKWSEFYPKDTIDQFKELIEIQNQTKCEFSWSVHLTAMLNGITEPNAEYEARKEKLKAKFDQLYDIGVRRFCILNDDFGAGSNEMVVKLVNDLNKEYIQPKGCKPIIYCPKGYNNAWANKAELDAMKGFDDDVLIFWTGLDVNSPFEQSAIDFVINNTGHSPVFWVNYPCNEHAKSGIFLGSSSHYIRDNITGLAGAVSNPIFFAEADKVALFQLASYFWNVNDYSSHTEEVWEQCFKYLQPEVYDAYLTIARNVSNCPGSGRVPQGFEESLYIKEELESVEKKITDNTLTVDDKELGALIAEFAHMQTAVADFMENCNNSALVQELSNPGNTKGGEGWLEALSNVAKAGEELLRAEVELLKENPDTGIVWEKFASASAEMNQYNNRVYQFPDGASRPNVKSGSKRLVPFVEACMEDVKAAIDEILAEGNEEIPADRIYTNMDEYAQYPLTIEDKEYGVRGIGKVTLEPGQYIGMKKKDIAKISSFLLQGEGVEGLTLEYSLRGDKWTKAKAGELSESVLARYVRLRNDSDKDKEIRLHKLAVVIENLEQKMSLESTNMGELQAGTWDMMFDGDETTYAWTNRAQKTGDYLTIDLGKVKEINDVTFVTADGNPRIYNAKVSISKDNKEFTQISTFADNGVIRPPYRDYACDAGGKEGRYVRLEVTAPIGWYLKIHEIYVNKDEQETETANANPITTNTNGDVKAVNDKDLSSVFQVAAAKDGAYLDYQITDNVNVEQFTIMQGSSSNANVSIEKADGTVENLGQLTNATQTFGGWDGDIYAIHLDFEQDSNVQINEILVKYGEDTSGDVGEAVENIYLDSNVEDSKDTVNLALKQPVEVSGIETPNVKPESAVDGDLNTKWDSGYLKGNGAVSPQWIIVDLGGYTNLISQINMKYYNKVYPTNYEIQISNDKTKWITLDTITKEDNGPTYPTDSVTLDVPVQARYVRLLFHSINANAAGNAIGLREVEVNGVRRHAPMEYVSVEEFEDQKIDVNGTVEMPKLVKASIQAENDESAADVQVIPVWEPESVDTSVEGRTSVVSELPYTYNLVNTKGLQAQFDVIVGDEQTEPSGVSTAVLEYAIELAKTADTDKVVDSVRKRFEKALNHAKEVLDAVKAGDTSVTQADIDESWKALIEAMQYLSFKQGDKTDLKKVILFTESLKLEEYLENGKQEFTKALAEAKAVLEDQDAMQDEVDSAWKELLLAASKLQKIPDKSALEELISLAETFRAVDYEEKDFAAMRTALAEAKEVIADENATQEMVDTSVAELEGAIARLTSGEKKQPSENSGRTVVNADTSAVVHTADKENAVFNSGKDKIKSAKTGDSQAAATMAGLMALAAAAVIAVKRKQR